MMTLPFQPKEELWEFVFVPFVPIFLIAKIVQGQPSFFEKWLFVKYRLINLHWQTLRPKQLTIFDKNSAVL
jgi:hypothetical protein